MDNNIKLEPIDDNNVIIKEEEELVIENEAQWTITIFNDENEYYQEFTEQSQDVYPERLIKNENYCEDDLEYINECEDYCYDAYGTDDYEENEGGDANMENNCDESLYKLDLENYAKSHLEELEKQANDKQETHNSNAECKYRFNKWLNKKYVKPQCPICTEILTDFKGWRKHIILNHKESIEESESNYHFKSSGIVCKKCNKEYISQISRYLHSITHTDVDAKLYICICKICNFNSSTFYSIQKHIAEKHPQVMKEFRHEVSFLKCPLCPNTYEKETLLWYHFSEKHPQEYKYTFRYNCHLCNHEQFKAEELFLEHLIVKHRLNSWKILNYRKPFEDKEYLSCIKCNSLFVKNETRDLLKHYLMHENDYYWTCKFCCEKTDLKKSPSSHICKKMVRYYGNYRNEAKVDKILKNPKGTELKIKNLQEFEKYIAHVCPFCNIAFDKMLKWQDHLKTVHKLDTLEGLEMNVIANDSKKLICKVCYTIVLNSPQQLHAHRFQHLPYKPYKCLQCSAALNTFKTSCNHVLKLCKDEEDVVENAQVQQNAKDVTSMIAIQCSLCDCRKFSDTRIIRKHFEDEHNNFEEFFIKHSDASMTCKICHNKYAKGEIKTFEHLHQHLVEKTYKCAFCLRSYATSKSCYQHLQKKHYAEPSNTYKTFCCLEDEDKVNHVEMLPQLGKRTSKSYTLNEFAEFITYACPECNEGMSSQQKWHLHVTTQHDFFDETNLYLKDAEGVLKCRTCNMTLVSSTTQQQKHKLTHMPYRSFICNLCYSRFNSLGILYQHFRRLHFAQGRFECPVCLEVLKTSYQRAEHLKKTHPRNEWPANTCIICYKILSSKGALNSHIITHNANRFKYVCYICGSKYVALRDLNSHMEKHQKKMEIEEATKSGDDLTAQSGSKNCPSYNSDESSDESEDGELSDNNTFVTKRKKIIGVE